MSISPLHGGLVFQEDLVKSSSNSSNKQQEEEKESSLPKTQTFGLGEKDINEFFNPRPSDLPLDERVRLVLSVGEEVVVPPEVRDLL